MAVDVDTLQQLLHVTGPVTLTDGTVLNAGERRPVPDPRPVRGSRRQRGLTGIRQDSLGSLASAALNALNNESLDLKNLATAMTTATEGRHLLVWSAEKKTEDAWVGGGVAGQLSPDSAMVAVINHGGNKLDQYLAGRHQPPDHPGRRRHRRDLDRRPPEPDPGGTVPVHRRPVSRRCATVYGEYIGSPGREPSARGLPPRGSGGAPIDALGAEGPVWLLATPVDVKAGATQQIVVTFRLPAGHGSMTIVPSARLSPVSWRYRGSTYDDDAPFTLSW